MNSRTAAAPDFETTTRLVARSLGTRPEDLLRGIRRAEAADVSEVVEFRRQNLAQGGGEVDRAYLEWRYRFGRADRGLGDLWILRVQDRLLGILGTEDMACRLGDRRVNGVRTMDILLEHQTRARGLGVWLNQAVFSGSDFTLAVGGNEFSAGTVKRLFTPLPPVETWAQPIDIGRYARRRLGSSPPAALAIATANLALRSWRRVSTRGGSGKLRVDPVDRFDGSVEALAPVPARGRLIVERNAHYLNYRLLDNPRARYNVLGAWDAGVLAGYAAWRPVTGENGDSFVHIIDWSALASSGGADVVQSLWARIAIEAEAAGCSFVLATHQNAGEWKRLESAGFLGPRPGREKIVGLHVRDPSMRDILVSASWNLGGLDDDNDGL